jgi:hypothetical protein
MMNGNGERPENPQQIKLEQEVVQRKIEATVGNLLVQICIKDAIIEKLQGELNSYKLGIIDSDMRPGPGQPLVK